MYILPTKDGFKAMRDQNWVLYCSELSCQTYIHKRVGPPLDLMQDAVNENVDFKLKGLLASRVQ
uniref:Uncharacterized protein n=1 Tax=Rhizophora mucronata TaxID=61149 RepID=A0A2P2Q3N2_RHIMU